MSTVADYEVLFVNDRGRPKKSEHGAVLELHPNLPGNFVVGTARAMNQSGGAWFARWMQNSFKRGSEFDASKE